MVNSFFKPLPLRHCQSIEIGHGLKLRLEQSCATAISSAQLLQPAVVCFWRLLEVCSHCNSCECLCLLKFSLPLFRPETTTLEGNQTPLICSAAPAVALQFLLSLREFVSPYPSLGWHPRQPNFCSATTKSAVVWLRRLLQFSGISSIFLFCAYVSGEFVSSYLSGHPSTKLL